MTKTSIPHRELEIKKQVVERPRLRVDHDSLYQVWQPRVDAWFHAMEQRRHDPSPRHCYSEYLEFPRDFDFVALVIAESLQHVYACMNDSCNDGASPNVIQLTPKMRSGSPGDVIVTPSGETRWVTSSGFRAVPHVMPT